MNTLKPTNEVIKNYTNEQATAMMLQDALFTDRQHAKEVLVERLEGMKLFKLSYQLAENSSEIQFHNQAMDEAIALVEETFNSDNN